MNVKEKEIQMLLKNENVECIGVVNAVGHLNKKKRQSFKTSMWMEIKDAKSQRSIGKKFPLLNLALLTKKDPQGELQGQTVLGKFSTHEYRVTDQNYETDGVLTGPQKLQSSIMGFFQHYHHHFYLNNLKLEYIFR